MTARLAGWRAVIAVMLSTVAMGSGAADAPAGTSIGEQFPARSGEISASVAQALRPALPLRVPVKDIAPAQLVDTFTDQRGSDRSHEAIDILAPRGTPVVAVDDGVVVKLFLSKPGGITVYQFDRTRSVAYYYAHLEAYADGLAEGQLLKRGDPIGFVGSTGNANPATPHLHFAVFELGPEKQWWKGRAIRPLSLFR
ncbi:peptidase M23-like protein [Panacagrimonas perspica]|uniref:Peptidase M23-like protein n=1 Tax=Panacagrimonas perspica TaxID=381431 RepID=A0A4R7PB19_9GAMM|nr:M23 family metallopeptidase [Panacagrimonas perspica]TDU31148.1 peptidase M23-like protein [Panacagrimonas perspica]